MSLIEKYKLLKREGSSIDRRNYILSLVDKREIETFLKRSSITSYDDLQMLIFLSKSTKNQTNLYEIFKNDSLLVCQRADAAKAWLRFQQDEKQIHQFVVETMMDLNIPRLIKHQILKCLHHIHYLKISSSFFYDLVCHLTKFFHHNEFNIDAHILPFCSSNQIMKLLSQWSLTRYSQIHFSSSFHSKLIRYQPLIIIYLIKGDLIDKYTNYDELRNYFRQHKKLLEFLARKESKAMCQLAIEYVNQLDKHKRFLPGFIISEEKRMFNKAPDEMIQLIALVASHQPGIIKYESPWDYSGIELSVLNFPRSFSIDNYIRLFFILYDTCKWSLNDIHNLVSYMLINDVRSKKVSILRQQRKWFFDIVVEKRIGKEEFLNKLLSTNIEISLHVLSDYTELRIPLVRHLVERYDQSDIMSPEQRASFLRYELMNSEIFNQFLSLSQQSGSDANSRKRMYSFFLQCAISTDQKSVNNVLQWMKKRFINEQLSVIEYFLRNLSQYNEQFHLEYLPDNFNIIEEIMDIAFNHLQKTLTTVETILAYGFSLLILAEHYQNKQQQEKVQEFASKIIKRYYSVNANFPDDNVLLYRSFPIARNLFANILISYIFPKLISKCLITEINNLLLKHFDNVWRLTQIDSFLYSFFFEHLRYSTQLQSAFDINEHSFLISLLLKPKSTRLERIHQLLNDIDQIFFFHIDVQRIILYSQQYRQFIDKLLEDEKCIDVNKLSNKQINLNSTIQNKKLPGFNINILIKYYYQLTGQQQERITNIILNDYLQDTDVTNLEKLKSLHVLNRLSHTHHYTIEWIEKNENLFSSVVTNASSCNNAGRGANIQAINNYILSLPAIFDLSSQDLHKQFHRLKEKLNASNTTIIRNALLNISQKVTDQYFLQYFIEFIHSEHFSKLGITTNKAMLRLLVEYRYNSMLITSVLKPLWDSRPHPDIRTCLVKVLLDFINESNIKDEKSVVWLILEQAAHDDYDPVVLALFGANDKGICRSSIGLKDSSTNLVQIFVQRVQMKILDHPTSLTARIWAWPLLDSQYCNMNIVIEKARQLCIHFDKNANILWKKAFEKILAIYKVKRILANDIMNFIQSIIDYEKKLDYSNENNLHDQSDLRIYCRINELLEIFISSIGEIDQQERQCFHSLALSILQCQVTRAPLIGKFLMKMAQNKEDLEEILIIFQQYLSSVYFEHTLLKLASYLGDNDGSCPFVQQLSIDEKFHLAIWFINERNQPLFVFDLLKNQLFNKTSIDKQQCQVLLRQMRQSSNLLLRQQVLEYVIPWKQDGTLNIDDT
ncbi:unnamed protein product [Rotaria sordida]|uniref:Uncharacterized protein n=1 Tax=Rotaria sordida TaxID=392033 RepID=A0A819APP9_9BILA|nr:unnamed protein product [Rotaria sordida]